MVPLAQLLVAVLASIALISGGARAADKRIALVIGNAAYQSAPVLDNTLNDAEAMASALKSVGFEVLDGRNLSKSSMGKMLGRFAKAIQGADAALFYYAGHGLQFEGQNYLLPIDAKIEDEFGLRFEATRLEDVIATLHYASGVQILVLDACRNNPFAAQLARMQGTRDIAVRPGLAPIQRTQGMLIAYATQANDVAADGGAQNSPFTWALASEIKIPGEEIATVFRKVQIHVYEATAHRQMPELSMSLLGNFYFNTGETDLDAWKKVSMTQDPQQLTAFIDNHPESQWAEAARKRRSELAEREILLRESASRGQRIRELTAQAGLLGEKIKQAEERRKQAVETLEKRTQSPSKELNSAAAQSSADSRNERKAGDEKLAAAVKEQSDLVLTLSEEKQRIDAERKAAERAAEERLKSQKKASLDKIDMPYQPAQMVSPPPPRHANKYSVSKCASIMSRLQLGEQSQSDLDALKQCAR